MVDEADDINEELEDGDEEGEGGKKKKKLAGKTLVLFIILPVVAVAILGFGAMKFLGGGDKEEVQLAEHEKEVTPPLQDPNEVEFIPVEEFLVNIRTNDNRTAFLNMSVTLEVNKGEDKKTLEAAMPRIRDKFQVYLQELRLEDLTGAAGTQRVKEELLRRVNIAASPVQVNAVLIREMVVQ